MPHVQSAELHQERKMIMATLAPALVMASATTAAAVACWI